MRLFYLYMHKKLFLFSDTLRHKECEILKVTGVTFGDLEQVFVM
ncbi:hypothetical protein MADA3029_170040 [Vibrio nigripulchritudo MADA3029]|uniref:Uncharacterized protein n=1 Tax=Vibrio nigripulchritudo SOn1 TaxID=1238450 RepID=A0AAV2VQ05_9VIBR|nr:hypothetical protein VIBNIMADA3020_820040 [Vibrio nigripulchritudo MADA3020]CCN53148.1 hypothetical protein VIBNIMADA3021_200001 [Vibrio nigripulchritudo MADA3021]CCN58562.1 hypothetical protein MADA3029_170040 [Vibrio nigripulchritudo MADA3029]CCO46729.1 hypothetical protein VIBNISOn1_1880001 [Vibrio nigripulchritudo SOn1]